MQMDGSIMFSINKRKIIAVIFAISVFLAGCKATELPQGQNAVWHLVIIGDSSLWGVGEAYAAQIEENVGVKVVLEDFALSGQSAGEVLDVLQTGESSNFQLQKLPVALSKADIVVMFVNPIDSIIPENPLDMDGCFAGMVPKSCNPAAYDRWMSDLKAIWAKTLELRKGKPTVLRATDLYSPLVSSWAKHDVFEACNECWVNMSNATRSAAEAYNIPFLSRYDVMNGASHTEDLVEKGYIRSDGEHLSEFGAEYVAELLAQMGYEPVTPP